MSKETSGPAFPYEERTGDGQPSRDHFGMTLRQYAAIKLKVADSGIDWLDEMITKSNRDAIATEAMQGILAGQHPITKEADVFYVVSKVSYEFADAIAKATGETK